MKKERVKAARELALKFLNKIDALERDVMDTDAENRHYYAGSKHTAAVRRASMDLTRALAEMRRA